MGWSFKGLYDTSLSPNIHDIMLPQNEFKRGEGARPLPRIYPVWYFLNGRIAQSSHLQKLLRLERPPYLRQATVCGFTRVTQRGCTVMVRARDMDGSHSEDVAQGIAYLVRSEAEESRLRYFKTSHFQVSPCKITLLSMRRTGAPYEVKGLTFSFCDGEEGFQTMHSKPFNPIPRLVGNSVAAFPVPTDKAQTSRPTGAFTEIFDTTEKMGYYSGLAPLNAAQSLYLKHEKGKSNAVYTTDRKYLLMSSFRPVSPLLRATNVSDVSSSSDSDDAQDVASQLLNSFSKGGSRSGDTAAWWQQPLGALVPALSLASDLRPASTVEWFEDIEELRSKESEPEVFHIEDIEEPAGTIRLNPFAGIERATAASMKSCPTQKVSLITISTTNAITNSAQRVDAHCVRSHLQTKHVVNKRRMYGAAILTRYATDLFPRLRPEIMLDVYHA